MGKRIGLSILLIAIAVSLILPTVRADKTTIADGDQHEKTYTLKEGDIIKWDFEVIEGPNIDFRIEDSDENEHFSLNNAEQDDDQFAVPEDGKWTVIMKNDHPSQSVEVEYDIDIERVPFLPSWLIWVVLILVLLVIIGTVLTTRRPSRPPQYPPQQPPTE
jgi:hypothetical protein